MHLDLKRNLGNVDRGIRLIVGLIILTLPRLLRIGPAWSWVLYGVALFDIVQAFAGY